jgi:hypothetical protein
MGDLQGLRGKPVRADSGVARSVDRGRVPRRSAFAPPGRPPRAPATSSSPLAPRPPSSHRSPDPGKHRRSSTSTGGQTARNRACEPASQCSAASPDEADLTVSRGPAGSRSGRRARSELADVAGRVVQRQLTVLGWAARSAVLGSCSCPRAPSRMGGSRRAGAVPYHQVGVIPSPVSRKAAVSTYAPPRISLRGLPLAQRHCNSQ